MAVVLGVLIVIHELGHHLVAKFFGVRVEVFSVGFGKRLLGFKYGETDYRLSALPLGGYVKMAGENPMEARTGDPGEFASHPRWQRILIALAGPAMNIALAIIVVTACFMYGIETETWSDQPVELSFIDEKTPAAAAGLLPGDVIVRYDSIQNPTWGDIRIRNFISQTEAIPVAVKRGNEMIYTSLKPMPVDPTEEPITGLVHSQKIIVTHLFADLPLMQAGIQLEDEIVSVNGIKVESIPQLQAMMRTSKEAPLDLTVRRGTQVSNYRVTPKVIRDDAGKTLYVLGLRSIPTKTVSFPFATAFQKSLTENKRSAFLIIELVKRMVQRRTSIKQMDGPIGIGRAAGAVVKSIPKHGWVPTFMLLAIISLNLGVFNLLPIPILDGGLILMLTVESVMRRDINQRLKERLYQTAFVFLVIFAVIVIFNDVTKLKLF